MGVTLAHCMCYPLKKGKKEVDGKNEWGGKEKKTKEWWMSGKIKRKGSRSLYFLLTF